MKSVTLQTPNMRRTRDRKAGKNGCAFEIVIFKDFLSRLGSRFHDSEVGDVAKRKIDFLPSNQVKEFVIRIKLNQGPR